MQLFKTIFQWLVIIGVCTGAYFLLKNVTFPVFSLQPYEVVILSLSIAFMWVEVLKLGVTKPFNCLKCMTGWIALILGILSFGWAGFIFLPLGLFVGAVFEIFKMRYL